MEENKSKRITATEARKIADSTDSFLNRVYKAIKEAAKDGEVSLGYYCCNLSKVTLDHAIKELEEAGFTVTPIKLKDNWDVKLEHSYEELKIHW